jgi:arginyl-tRNA synthetase
MEERLRTAIEDALVEMGAADAPFTVEWPDLDHGDYATNAALVSAKQLGKSPHEVASGLADALRAALGASVEKIEVAGPGFINFTLARPVLSGMVKEAAERGSEWGKTAATEGKTYSIEYSCPNPFKEMHIGHLMSTVVGEALCRLIEGGGAKVVRDSYGGDVGPHVAKALWGLRQKGITDPASAKEIGDAYAHGSRAYEESEETKGEIDELNRAIYAAEDTELMELWRRGRETSLAAFRELYKRLDTHFDYFFFESETAARGLELVRDGLKKDVFKESEGAVIYEGEKKGLHTLVFITSKGTPTYEAKEVGLAFLVEERVPSDFRFILTAAEQVGHFAVVKAALEELAPLVGKKTSHVPHGFLRLTSGKMSSREGNVITAAALIEEVMQRASEKNEDPLVAEAVALGAIKYMILRQAAGGDILFDVERSLSLEGDSGPYLQYALVRARKLLTYASKSEDGSAIPETPYLVERLIVRFPEVVAHAIAERAPHHIAQYLTKLAGEWNSFYASEQVLGSPEEAYKQVVAKAFAATMENGLRMLAIPTPERM